MKLTKKEKEIIRELRKEETYSVGDRFKLIEYGWKYILCVVDYNMVNMFCLDSGSRWSRPIKVEDIWKITRDEINQLFDGFEFEKL